MSDLISRQAAIDAIHKAVLEMFDFCDDISEEPMTYADEKMLEVNKLITGKIMDLPTTPVVRCKDCKWWSDPTYRECTSPNWNIPEADYFITPAGFYCGWGEREAEE